VGRGAQELSQVSDHTVTEARGGDLSGLILRFAATLSGLALFGVMLIVTVSVIFRYVLNAPILGSQELIQIGMGVVVMLAMPYTALTGKHIQVDILDNHLGKTGRFAADLLARAVGIYVLWLLIGKAWEKMWDAIEFGDVTNMIEVPIWIAYAAIVFGMGFFALVMVLQIYSQIRHGVAGHE